VEGVDSTGILLRDLSGRPIPLIDMSDGYRSSLAMLVDVYRHMVNVYGPNILARHEDGGVVVTRPGVVLIDELTPTFTQHGSGRSASGWFNTSLLSSSSSRPIAH
jgi:hypothetical protein